MKKLIPLMILVSGLVAISVVAIRSTIKPVVAQEVADTSSSTNTAYLDPRTEKAVAIRCNLCGLCNGPTVMDKHVCPLRATVATAWSLTAAERIATEGLAARVQSLRSEIARVASGDQQKAQEIINVALMLRGIDADEREIAKEAASSRKLEIALVQSTTSPTSWAPLK